MTGSRTAAPAPPALAPGLWLPWIRCDGGAGTSKASNHGCYRLDKQGLASKLLGELGVAGGGWPERCQADSKPETSPGWEMGLC